MSGQIELTPEAEVNVSNMQQRLWQVAQQYGHHSVEYLAMVDSLNHVLLTILRFPGKVFAEDNLSLIIQSYITIGCIWHPKRIKDEEGKVQEDPFLGLWSTHS